MTSQGPQYLEGTTDLNPQQKAAAAEEKCGPSSLLLKLPDRLKERKKERKGVQLGTLDVLAVVF